MEYAKQIIAWELLVILVFSSLLIINEAENGGLRFITGKAVVTKDSVLTEVEAAVPQLQFLKDAGDFSLCLIVNIDPTTKYSYEVLKIGDAVAVTSSDEEFCKGEANEDFIISYISYEKLKEHLDAKPSLQEFKKTSDGTNFYLYPSKQVLPGLQIANPTEFNEKFANVVKENLPRAEAQEILSPKSPEARKALSIVSYIFYFISGLILIIVVVSILLVKYSKKPEIAEDLELISYIKSSLSEGYPEEQIRQTLMQSGWSEEKIQKAFESVQVEVTVPETFA